MDGAECGTVGSDTLTRAVTRAVADDNQPPKMKAYQ